MLKETLQFEQAEDILCSGWRIDCPYDGVFQPDSKECEECNNEAVNAMGEWWEEKVDEELDEEDRDYERLLR